MVIQTLTHLIMKPKKDKKIKVQPTGFWRSLFCKHEWTEIAILRVFEENTDTIPIRNYRRWLCSNCQKIAKRRF